MNSSMEENPYGVFNENSSINSSCNASQFLLNCNENQNPGPSASKQSKEEGYVTDVNIPSAAIETPETANVGVSVLDRAEYDQEQSNRVYIGKTGEVAPHITSQSSEALIVDDPLRTLDPDDNGQKELDHEKTEVADGNAPHLNGLMIEVPSECNAVEDSENALLPATNTEEIALVSFPPEAPDANDPPLRAPNPRPYNKTIGRGLLLAKKLLQKFFDHIYAIIMWIVALVVYFQNSNYVAMGIFFYGILIECVDYQVKEYFLSVLKEKHQNLLWASNIYGFIVTSSVQFLPLLLCWLLDTHGFEDTGAVVIFHVSFFVLPLAANNILYCQRRYCSVVLNTVTLFLWFSAMLATIYYFDDEGKSLPYGSLISASVIGFVFGITFCALCKNNGFKNYIGNVTYLICGFHAG